MCRSQCVSKGAVRLFTALMPAVLAAQQPPPPPNQFTTTQSITDEAQRTTLAFAGLGMMTGNLEAQSFFPPGKVADYTGFQYLRDNDPDNMGHNTSFLTRVANNVIYILNDAQFTQLKTLAAAQIDQINLYGYKRYPLMKAFRRLMDGDIPSGSAGLNLGAVKQASRELYALDGRISFDRALLYANIISSMDLSQKAYLDSMKGKGWKSWPDITDDQIRTKMGALPQGTAVAVMTYASDLFSWYAGSLDADVYFCPERHGTYFGSFYIKDAPAVGHEGYGINEQLTATAGAALSDSSLGYVTAEQAALMSGLVETQRNNLYAGTTNIVDTRTKIASLLRSLLQSTANSDAVKAQVLELSAAYGDLDGENNYAYATVFAKVYQSLGSDQKARLAALRKSIMSGKYADGTAFDFSLCATPFLYSEAIKDTSSLASYIANTDYLFGDVARFVNAASFAEGMTSPGALMTVFSDAELAASVNIAYSKGLTQSCDILYASPHQINFAVPQSSATGAARLIVQSAAGTGISGKVDVNAVAPGLFTLDGSIAAITALRINGAAQRSDVNPYASPIDLGPATDQVYLSLYGTGVRGYSSSSTVALTIAGLPVPVTAVAASAQYPGLDQVNVGPLPRGLARKGKSNLMMTVDGKTANTVTVSFQ